MSVKTGGTSSYSSMIWEAVAVLPQASTAVYSTSNVPAQLPLSSLRTSTATLSSRQSSVAVTRPAASASSPSKPSSQSAQGYSTAGSADRTGAVLSCTSMVCVPEAVVALPTQSVAVAVQVRWRTMPPPSLPSPSVQTSSTVSSRSTVMVRSPQSSLAVAEASPRASTLRSRSSKHPSSKMDSGKSNTRIGAAVSTTCTSCVSRVWLYPQSSARKIRSMMNVSSQPSPSSRMFSS